MKINIPNPCSEKYDTMSPTELGRMCKICNTEVVDFTNWETKDIVGYIQKSNHKVCGTLKSPLLDKSYSFRGKNWLAISASLLIFTSWSNLKAQNTNNEYINKKSSDNDDFHMSTAKDSITLKFIDTKNRILPHVVIYDKNSKLFLHANSMGIIKIPKKKYSSLFEARLIGYEKKNINILPNQKDSLITITLVEEVLEIGEVIVEPIERNKPRFYKGINTIKQIAHRNKTSNQQSSNSIIQKLKRLFNIFSIKDKE